MRAVRNARLPRERNPRTIQHLLPGIGDFHSWPMTISRLATPGLIRRIAGEDLPFSHCGLLSQLSPGQDAACGASLEPPTRHRSVWRKERNSHSWPKVPGLRRGVSSWPVPM